MKKFYAWLEEGDYVEAAASLESQVPHADAHALSTDSDVVR
jgi:hypothetical protein